MKFKLGTLCSVAAYGKNEKCNGKRRSSNNLQHIHLFRRTLTQPLSFTQNVTRILVEAGLVLEQDFTIDLNSDRIITLNDAARDRFLKIFPTFELSYVITEETDAGWQVVASLDEKLPDNLEFEDEEINALIRSVTQEKPC